MKQIRIMVFPCGSEIGLELHRALKNIRFIDLVGASGADDHGRWVYRNYIGNIPFVTDPACIDALNRHIDAQQIDFIFPALDSVMAVLSANRARLHARLLAPPDETVQICRSKARTYAHLAGCDFLPRVYQTPDEVSQFPVIIKPAESQGAQGFAILESAAQLQYEWQNRTTAQVVCEYLGGEEYTVSCFTDRHGALRFVSCRDRRRVKSGISVRSVLLPLDARLAEIAAAINRRLTFRGAWFFQVKKNQSGEYRLLECACRVAGTACVERAAGVNLPLLTVFDALDMDVDIAPQTDRVEVDRALHNVFRVGIDYDEVYLDFDDTLIVHERVNFAALQFVYQCVTRKIPVILLTRHNTDVVKDLEAYRIAPTIFDRIICLPRSARKIDHISPSKKALFVDDSFAERQAMQQTFGIRTWGVDAVEALLEEWV